MELSQNIASLTWKGKKPNIYLYFNKKVQQQIITTHNLVNIPNEYTSRDKLPIYILDFLSRSRQFIAMHQA